MKKFHRRIILLNNFPIQSWNKTVAGLGRQKLHGPFPDENTGQVILFSAKTDPKGIPSGQP
ncbi:hypothetical protein ABIE64_004424 [Thalassospira sp. MBR-102]|jgi:hypothetical protein|uniref:hypothetical protein n=1 Tax=Thalassospira sp. MBR-102 TaxID=3156466 RepID=UPI0033987F80